MPKPQPRFAIGDHVQRIAPRSYLFPGVVIGISPKLDGKTILYTVECIAPGVEGMAHEFTENALEPLDLGLWLAATAPNPDLKTLTVARAAFRAGWLTNAVPPDEHDAGPAYVWGCEQADWDNYTPIATALMKKADPDRLLDHADKAVTFALNMASGYPVPEMDAGIAYAQARGFDRWSMQAQIDSVCFICGGSGTISTLPSLTDGPEASTPCPVCGQDETSTNLLPAHRNSNPTTGLQGLRDFAAAIIAQRSPNQILGADYLERWWLIKNQLSGSIYLHRFLRSDKDVMHDHPFNNTSLILEGEYIEETPVGSFHRRAGDIVYRRATDAHRIQLINGPVTTLFFTGPKIREWGFHTAKGWVHWLDFTNARDQENPLQTPHVDTDKESGNR